MNEFLKKSAHLLNEVIICDSSIQLVMIGPET